VTQRLTIFGFMSVSSCPFYSLSKDARGDWALWVARFVAADSM
jgi:hypothetical protein